MHMQMRHAFTCVRSAVDHDSIAAGYVQFLCHVARNQQQFAQKCGVLISRLGETRNCFFWYNQDMHWRLRVDVVKRNRVLIFPNDFRRNLACDNFFENRHEP